METPAAKIGWDIPQYRAPNLFKFQEMSTSPAEPDFDLISFCNLNLKPEIPVMGLGKSTVGT